jgi:hypothetical protein
MNRVFMTQSGFVQIELAAPAVMADRMCSPHGCSRVSGWYPLTCGAGYSLVLWLGVLPMGGSPKTPLIPSYTVK